MCEEVPKIMLRIIAIANWLNINYRKHYTGNKAIQVITLWPVDNSQTQKHRDLKTDKRISEQHHKIMHCSPPKSNSFTIVTIHLYMPHYVKNDIIHKTGSTDTVMRGEPIHSLR